MGAAVTSNAWLAMAPGNFLSRKKASGLPGDSVVNVSQPVTMSKIFLTGRLGRLSPTQLQQLNEGIRLVLGL